MEKLLSEMKVKNNQTIRKEDLVIGMEYTTTGIKCFTTKYGKKIVIIINFKGEMVDLFASKRFDSNAADLERHLQD